MTSIELRIRRLEESRTKTIPRSLTDAELAVRIANLQSGTPVHEAVMAIFKRDEDARNQKPVAMPR
ncbi:MAG: hypothetical protein LC137_04105 [Burkholderiales bacterium]|nr:hypothetical protein [Burkholderiales bacterium]